MTSILPLPSQGKPKDQVLAAMREVRQRDVKWQHGKAFSLVYFAGHEVDELLKEAYTLFFSENGLNPSAFPSLRKFETEVVAMTASLLGGDTHVAGSMTSGGTESLLMAVKTARDWSRVHRPEVKLPEIVLPLSAHPAFDKAAEYFDVKVVRTPLRPDYRADPVGMQAAITPQTILLAASAPAYPHGVVDPIREIAQIARESNLLFHVDACVGGFMLPFVRKLGYPVPDFDFSVPGVTSMSADLHKYAYAAKPASVVLYRDHELRRHQFFVSTDWPGGIYPAPTMTGTRPGGSIAAAWAVLNYLGDKGYLAITETVMQTVVKIRQGLKDIPGIKILSDPEMSVMALASDKLNIYDIGDELALRGWHLDRQQFPPTLHLTVNYAHAGVADEFLKDLADAVKIDKQPSFHKVKDRLTLGLVGAAVRLLPSRLVSRLTSRASSLVGVKGSALPQRQAAMYGMLGSLPNRGDLKEMVLDLIDKMNSYP